MKIRERKETLREEQQQRNKNNVSKVEREIWIEYITSHIEKKS